MAPALDPIPESQVLREVSTASTIRQIESDGLTFPAPETCIESLQIARARTNAGEGTPRCIVCESPEIQHVDYSGPTGVSFLGSEEGWSDVGIRCLACGAIEDSAGENPALDELDAMLEYFADAPMGEPPADFIEWAPDQYHLIPPAPKYTVKRINHAALTQRETQIAILVAGSRSNKQIAAQLGIAEQTVKGQLLAIYRKLKIRNRTGLALHVLRNLERAA